MNTPRFQDKVAIVTGAGCIAAGWGNGRAIAVRLAEEGARVLAVDRDPARIEETLSLAGAARRAIASNPSPAT
jgi:NAD(P)-dependent dehydrogenase (short-subunit alcohol dehydrogenase family)